MTNILGIIPARSGSTRVPGKNIKELGGKPLIEYTIKAALESCKLDRIIVSTDDENIAVIAENLGAEVPFIRPSELSKNTTPDQPVFLHALKKLDEIDGYKPDIVLNLRPTSPFKSASTINCVIDAFKDPKVDIVRTMTLVKGVHHPYWMYNLTENEMATPFLSEININNYYQSQLLPPIYRINGVVDGYRSKKIIDGDILTGSIKGVIISENESIEIDTPQDFSLCELKLTQES